MMAKAMDDRELRYMAMSFAVQTATMGECPTQVLARAELYAEFMLSPPDLARQRGEVAVKGTQLRVDRG